MTILNLAAKYFNSFFQFLSSDLNASALLVWCLQATKDDDTKKKHRCWKVVLSFCFNMIPGWRPVVLSNAMEYDVSLSWPCKFYLFLLNIPHSKQNKAKEDKKKDMQSFFENKIYIYYFKGTFSCSGLGYNLNGIGEAIH